MALEDRIEQLENELALIKVDIKQVLVELKELVLQDQNPLSGDSAAASALKSEEVVAIDVATDIATSPVV